MLRRQTRERRQYVYAKSLEAQERQTWERKQQLKDALATGKSLPTELKKDAKQLGRDLAFDEAQSDPTTHIDNEYSRAGAQDPKIVVTTSRDPSSKLLQFAKVYVVCLYFHCLFLIYSIGNAPCLSEFAPD